MIGYERPRTLPLRVPVQVGESLDSWLHRLAHRNGMPLLDLARTLGFGDRLRFWHNYALSWRLPADLLRSIEGQTGLAPGRLDHAVLDQFDPLDWKPIAGSRYCARCLTESGAHWPITWQLPYTFACLTHHCLLSTICPSCRRTPRSGISRRSGLLTPNHCTLRRSGEVCCADLLEHRHQYIRPGDARLSAQTWVNERLDRTDADAVTDLRDLDALVVWFLERIVPSDLKRLGPTAVRAVTEYRDQRRASAKHLPAAAAVTAALTCQAVDLITADERRRPALLAPLLRNVYTEYRPGRTPPRHPGPMILSHARLSRLSEPLRNKILISADPRLSVSERLRYRTCTSSPRLPEPGSTVATERARCVPQYLWHDWIVRFSPPRGSYVDDIAIDIAAALLIPANPIRNRHATVELNPWRNNISTFLSTTAHRHPDILSAICAIAAHLDTRGSPIDYRRRRKAFADVTLTDPDWDQLCERADAHPGKGARLEHARRYLFQLLTGADLTNPRHSLAIADKHQRAHYLQFQREMSSPLRDELHRHAGVVLAAAGIDEPLTWSPPAECVAGLNLPGRDPDDIDVDALHQLVIVQDATPTAAAHRLGVSITHVRYALQQLHQPPRPHRTYSEPAAARDRRERAAQMLTVEFFQREHLAGGKDLKTLMAETGFSRRLLHAHARQAGIKLVSRSRDAHIDQDWLREQAGTLSRANDDIAAELGLSGETIRRHRKNHGLPSRPTGGHGHVITNLVFPDLPRDIRRAVEGKRNGWQRLRRLDQTLAYPSMNAAAQALGLHTSNLNLQIQRLEADIGGPLLHRAPHRYTAMTLTRRGQRLLAHLDQPAIRKLIDRYASANTRPRPAAANQ